MAARKRATADRSPSVGAGAMLGQGMRRVLTTPGRMRAFNGLMAALLVASLYPVLLH